MEQQAYVLVITRRQIKMEYHNFIDRYHTDPKAENTHETFYLISKKQNMKAVRSLYKI